MRMITQRWLLGLLLVGICVLGVVRGNAEAIQETLQPAACNAVSLEK